MNIVCEELIFRYLRDECSEEERVLVDEWIGSSPQNRREFETLEKIVRASTLMKGIGSIEKEKARTRIAAFRKSERSILRRWIRTAAAVFIPLFMLAGGYFLLRPQSALTIAEQTSDILPGNAKAILTLSDGRIIDLAEAGASQVLDSDHTIEIASDANTVSYEAIAANHAETIINTITVPRGGQYNIRLSDGTMVWLNSESVLEFPVAFGPDSRQVRLQGEGFFDVAKDLDRKFIVSMGSSAIEVTGTSFNASCYPENSFNRAVLETGSIDFVTASGVTSLSVGDCATYDIATDKVAVERVDVEYYTSWRSGVFRFHNSSLKDIASALSRWYDVEFDFADPRIEQMRFSGAVMRDKPISLILELLEKTNSIKFSRSEGRALSVDYNIMSESDKGR